ncbi:hypothetical protein BKA63DRAFT_498437 [Paraphoma chrysanthemicola]|nr:hypothetical protein BKA63DRAFT_498437 [Paraphoma chrysanthemicola]
MVTESSHNASTAASGVETTTPLTPDSMGEYNEQNRAAFFTLPREVRDQIYVEAFGHEVYKFSYKDIKISAYHHPRIVIKRKACYFFNGLPQWLLSCKRICTEATSVFSGTRHFDFYPFPNRFIVTPEDRMTSVFTNSLVFHPGALQNIILGKSLDAVLSRANSAGIWHFATITTFPRITPQHQWFSLIEACRGPRLCMEMVWRRYWHNDRDKFAPQWLKGETEAFDYLDAQWSGKFRKIKLTVIYYSKSGVALGKMLELGESCVLRLMESISDQSKPVWQDEVEFEDTDGHIKWARSLIMERKV